MAARRSWLTDGGRLGNWDVQAQLTLRVRVGIAGTNKKTYGCDAISLRFF